MLVGWCFWLTVLLDFQCRKLVLSWSLELKSFTHFVSAWSWISMMFLHFWLKRNWLCKSYDIWSWGLLLIWLELLHILKCLWLILLDWNLICIYLTRLTLELDFNVCNLCRFVPEKAAALALDLLKELVEVIQFTQTIYWKRESVISNGFLWTKSRFWFCNLA